MKKTIALFLLCLAAVAGLVGSGSAGPPRQPLDLTGRIVGDNGASVPDATVYIYTAAPRTGVSAFCPSCYVGCGKRQTTDSHGAFRIKSLDPSLIFRVLVVRDGFEPTFASGVDPLRKDFRLTLRRLRKPANPERTATGCILDDLGQPVVGATVEPFGISYGTNGLYGTIPGVEPLAITDSRGFYHFTGKPNALLSVKVSGRGFAPLLVNSLKIGNPTPLTVRLSRGATVKGTLQDASGKGIANALIEIVHTERDIQTFLGWFLIGTDSQGNFNLPNLPAGKDYFVCARMSGLKGRGLATQRVRITTGKDEETTGPIRLIAERALVLQGQVVTSDGKPIPPGTRLTLGRCETWDTDEYVLDKDGRFTFRAVPADELTLFTYLPGYRPGPDTPTRRGEIGYFLRASAALPITPITLTLVPERPPAAANR